MEIYDTYNTINTKPTPIAGLWSKNLGFCWPDYQVYEKLLSQHELTVGINRPWRGVAVLVGRQSGGRGLMPAQIIASCSHGWGVCFLERYVYKGPCIQ